VVPLLQKKDEAYSALVQSSEPRELRSYCQQMREGITKGVWGEQVCQLTSNHSELFFFGNRGEVELIEELDALECTVQEERFFRQGQPMQRVRRLHAEAASLNYHTQLLHADDVQIWCYELPGHTLPTSIDSPPMMEGTATSLDLALKGKHFDIVAHNFQGRL